MHSGICEYQRPLIEREREKRMSRLKFIFFATLLLFVQSVCAMSNVVAVAKLSDLLNHFTTFQAKFQQKTLDAEQNIMQESSGTVALMRPGYFRWKSRFPTHQIVIANGKMLWIYDVDLKQATEQSLQQGVMSPAKLLSGHVDKTLAQFNVQLSVRPQSVVFQLTPKKPNQQFKCMTLFFTQNKLYAIQIKNNLHQTNVFQFSDVKLNGSLSRHLFEFTVPTGVDVVR